MARKTIFGLGEVGQEELIKIIPKRILDNLKELSTPKRNNTSECNSKEKTCKRIVPVRSRFERSRNFDFTPLASESMRDG